MTGIQVMTRPPLYGVLCRDWIKWARIPEKHSKPELFNTYFNENMSLKPALIPLISLIMHNMTPLFNISSICRCATPQSHHTHPAITYITLNDGSSFFLALVVFFCSCHQTPELT